MEPSILFVTTHDGVRIAFCTSGAGPPLILVRPWVSHLQLLWGDGAFRSFFERLAEHHLLVRYDGRGNGLSDRNVTDVAFDHLVTDLEAVTDHLQLRDVTLFGDTFGGPVAIAYSARHPGQVSRLILHGTYARGRDVASPERAAAIVALIRDMPDAAKLVLTHYTHPGPQDAPHRRVPMREIISPRVATQLYELAFEMDVSTLLPQIDIPTLILHRRGDLTVAVRMSLEMASQIPNAHMVLLEGDEHNCWEGDVAPALKAVGDFLGVRLEPAPATLADTGQAPLTILITDMEGSTALTQRLGDAKARVVLREHERMVREALKAHGGSEVKTMGDGFMASFSSATRALECAIAMQRAFAGRNASLPAHPEPVEGRAESGPSAHGSTGSPRADRDAGASLEPIKVRVGLNAGEPIAEDEDLFGTAVIRAARIAAMARGGEILASDVVRQLVEGKDFLFADRGETTLRGFDEPVRLYEVRWQPDQTMGQA